MIPAEINTIPTETSVRVLINDRKWNMNIIPCALAKESRIKLSVGGASHWRFTNPASAWSTTTMSHQDHNRSTAEFSATHSRRHFVERPSTIGTNPKIAVIAKSKNAMLWAYRAIVNESM